MSTYFKISKYTLIFGGIIFFILSIFAVFMVGYGGHDSGIKESSILANILMILLLMFSNQFQKLGERMLLILNWSTIITLLWVMINIINRIIKDHNKGEILFDFLLISIPLIFISMAVLGLINKENKKL